jgi:DNA-binding XRE family transcriptional regulator
MAAYKPKNGSTPLREVRRLTNLSRDELARRAGVGVATLYGAEHGRLPTLRTAQKLARVLGVSVDALFPMEDS